MALTKDRMTPVRDGEVMPFAVAAGAQIFQGALVATNAAGFLVAGSAATGLTYIGRADEHVDQSLVGKTCYILDDETVAATDATGTRSAAGKVLAVETAGVWVE